MIFFVLLIKFLSTEIKFFFFFCLIIRFFCGALEMHAFFCFPYPLYTSTVAQFKCFTKSNWIVFVARITISPNKLNAILIYSKSTLYWLTIDRSCNPFHRFHSYFYDPFFVFHSDKCEFQTFFFSLSLFLFFYRYSAQAESLSDARLHIRIKHMHFTIQIIRHIRVHDISPFVLFRCTNSISSTTKIFCLLSIKSS